MDATQLERGQPYFITRQDNPDSLSWRTGQRVELQTLHGVYPVVMNKDTKSWRTVEQCGQMDFEVNQLVWDEMVEFYDNL